MSDAASNERANKMADLGLAMSRHIHERVAERGSVPHDIGLTLLEIVDRHMYGTDQRDVVESLALRHMVRQWRNGRLTGDGLREFVDGMMLGDESE